MILELRQELWVDTPKGRAQVLMVVDRGPHSDLEWVCVIEETGEVWVTKNYDIKVCKNWTMGIRPDRRQELSQTYNDARNVSRWPDPQNDPDITNIDIRQFQRDARQRPWET